MMVEAPSRSKTPIDPYLKWTENLGNPAWPVLAATKSACRTVSVMLARTRYAESIHSVFQIMVDEEVLQEAAERLYLSTPVRRLVDQNTSLTQGFITLWDIRVRLREDHPLYLESQMTALQRLSWRDQIDNACLIRSAAKAPPLVISLDLPEATEDQRQVMALVEVLRKWSVLDRLPVGLLLGIGHPVRVHGLRKLLQTGVFPKYG
jgi:hypothetical protein